VVLSWVRYHSQYNRAKNNSLFSVAVLVALCLCCCFAMFRRHRRRRATNTGAPATGTGKSLFGGPWGRQQAAPVTGPGNFGNGYYGGGDIAAPPPAYGKGGGYAQNPPV
jgi:hypothetical protein